MMLTSKKLGHVIAILVFIGLISPGMTFAKNHFYSPEISNPPSPAICNYSNYEKQAVQYQKKTYHFCSPAIENLFRKNARNKIKRIPVEASQFKFTPATLTVHQGDIIQIIFTSADVTHGFYLKAFKINVSIKKGEKKVIEFIANKKGTFPFRCSVYCGMGHYRMTGRLVVQ